MKVGTKIMSFGKSKHAGQKGTVVRDYGNYLMITAEDQSYAGASKNSEFDLKVMQVDARECREIK